MENNEVVESGDFVEVGFVIFRDNKTREFTDTAKIYMKATPELKEAREKFVENTTKFFSDEITKYAKEHGILKN